MASLLDIAPATETVAGVTVTGVSARGIAYLLQRFPEIRMMMTGKDVGTDALEKLAPDAVAAIIAAGTGSPGNEQAEAAADRLSVELQVEFLEAIFRVTMPRGIGPFVRMLAPLLASQEDAAASDTAQATS